MDRRHLAIALAVALVAPFVSVSPSTAASPYLLPVPAGLKVKVFQGNTSQYNHSAGSKAQYAWDFIDGAAEFPVVAARGGTVIGARSDSTNTNCRDVSCWADANYVLIDHGDGTSALYLHLKTGSVTVKPGPQTVPQGTLLGNADSTGWSEGTHLHFMVEATPTSRTADGWWWGWSKEITFADAGLPLVDQYYVSQNAGGASTGPTPTPTPLADIARLLPASVGGVKAKLAPTLVGANVFDPSQYHSDESPFRNAVKVLAAKLGVPVQSVQMAVASYGQTTHVVVYQLAGAPEPALLQGWLAGPEMTDPGVTLSKVTLGGKAVTKWSQGPQLAAYIYAKGDLVFIVSSFSQTDSADAVSKLP